MHTDSVHFSDRQVTLYNTLDYPSYSLTVEKVKAAYRIAYSLLDKIAYFLNDYAKLGVPPQRVWFRTICYEKSEPGRAIRPQFLQSENLPLRGLYWLAKDLFDPTLVEAMEPDAQELYIIRNRIEHSYLKVHESLLPSKRKERDAAWTDRLAYSVQRSDFNAKTLHMFRLARAGLIYLAMAMHREEEQRDQGAPKDLKMPMTLTLWRDAWKR
jgi:hypothetical protein